MLYKISLTFYTYKDLLSRAYEKIGENWLGKAVFWPLHMHCGKWAHNSTNNKIVLNLSILIYLPWFPELDNIHIGLFYFPRYL